MADKKTALASEAKAENTDTMKNVAVTDEEQPKFPKLFGAAMFIGTFAWLVPAGQVRGVLLPQYLSNVDPSGKITIVALLATVTSIVAAISNIVFGALSDLTRTRWGKRTPWILGGSILEAAGICLVANETNMWAIIVTWGVVAAVENAVAAAMVAQEADRIAPKWRGTISTLYGLSYTASQIGAMVAAQFLGNPKLGMYVMALMGLVFGFAHVLLAHEPSNLDEPRAKFSWSMVWDHFSLPTKGSRDYWFAVIGKFLLNTGGTIVAGYNLYILTDYLKVGQKLTAQTLSYFGIIGLVLGVVFTAISGPLADKIHRLKVPVAVSTIAIGISHIFPYFWPSVWALYVQAILGAIGNGVYNAVDGALNLAVLPSKDTAGKDMGFINLANTLSQILGTVAASVIIQHLGGYKDIFLYGFIVTIVGGILTLMIKKVK